MNKSINARLADEVAAALDATPETLDLMGKILADLWSLGTSPDAVVSMLQHLQLPPETTRVIDLGCGKGAIAPSIAKQMGFQVLGIDAYASFLEEARIRSEQMGLSSLCRFELDEIKEVVRDPEKFNVIIYAAVDNVANPTPRLAKQCDPMGRFERAATVNLF